MPTYSINRDDHLAVHPDKDATVEEYEPTARQLARMSNLAPMFFDFTVGTGSQPCS